MEKYYLVFSVYYSNEKTCRMTGLRSNIRPIGQAFAPYRFFPAGCGGVIELVSHPLFMVKKV